jgi:hypothetical protein
MKITFTSNGRTYTWVGGYGTLFTSNERGVKPGDVRVIRQMTFYAREVGKPLFFGKSYVRWTIPTPSIEHGDITRVQKRVLGL